MTTDETLGALLAQCSEASLAAAWAFWDWHPAAAKSPVGITTAGDWLLVDRTGAYSLLETIEAEVTSLAGSKAALLVSLADPDFRDAHFLEALVLAVLGTEPLPSGKTLGFRVPPILGGSLGLENLEVVDAVTYQNWVGELHRELSLLPDGTRVEGVEIDAEGCVRLRTAR